MNNVMNIKDLLEKGRELRSQGKYEEAVSLYESHIDEFHSPRDRVEILRALAMAYLGTGDAYRALSTIQEAIKLAEDSNMDDDTLLTKLYTAAFDIHYYLGDISACERYRKMGMKHVDRADMEEQFNFYNLLAIYSFDKGRIGMARNYWEKCLEIATAKGDPKLIAIAYNNLGEVYRVKGEYRKALSHYRMAYARSKEGDDYRGMAINLLNMGEIERENGNLDKAAEYLKESIDLYEKHKDNNIASTSYATYAPILADMGRYDEAMDAAKKAMKIAEDMGRKGDMGEALMALGYVYEMMDDYKNAMRTYNEARKIFVEIANKVLLSECELAIGRVLLKGNMKDAARFHLEEAKKIANEIGEFKVVQKANSLLAKC